MVDLILEPEVVENVSLPINNGQIAPVNHISIMVESEEGKESEPINVDIDKKFPEKLVAYETISESFNTAERKILGNYTFGQSGAIKIGDYSSGVSGEIKISPDGILGKDKNGNTTFSLDGNSGDATFKGVIQAQTLIGGVVYVGSPSGNEGVYIDGGNKRIIVNDGSNPRIVIGNV